MKPTSQFFFGEWFLAYLGYVYLCNLSNGNNKNITNTDKATYNTRKTIFEYPSWVPFEDYPFMSLFLAKVNWLGPDKSLTARWLAGHDADIKHGLIKDIKYQVGNRRPGFYDLDHVHMYIIRNAYTHTHIQQFIARSQKYTSAPPPSKPKAIIYWTNWPYQNPLRVHQLK